MNDNFDDEEWVSKSQRKRECHALQDLGEALVQLEASALAKIPLEDDLRNAITAARKMKQRGALKRQLQFIGKLMRGIDAEPIRDAYNAVTNHYREDINQLHQLEEWRDRLLAEGDKVLGELLEAFPDADRQHIRQLIRVANKEKAGNKPPKSARELFQYLKSLMNP